MGDIDIINAFLRKEPFKRGNIRSNGVKLFVDNTCIGEWFNQRVLINNSEYEPKITKIQNMLYKTLITSHLIFRVLENIPLNEKNIRQYYDNN